MSATSCPKTAPLVEEALWAIREKHPRSTTLERLRLAHQADAQTQGLPQPRRLGEGVFHILSRIATPVSPSDLLLGRIAEEVPDAQGEAFFQNTVKDWKGRGIPPWMPDGGHECFAWERVLRLGLGGLEEFARAERARRASDGANSATLDWLDGAIRIYEGFRLYARRYAQAALDAQARRCENIADHAPRTFAEALQLIWLITHAYSTMFSVNSTLTMGRADQLLLGLYRADLAAGRLTPTEAAALIDDFYARNNFILGRGEHQMSGGCPTATGWARNLCYDSPQYLLLGGRPPDGLAGSPCVNELTELFVRRINPAFENPVIILRYTPDFPEPLWRVVCDKLRANASILVYNDEVVIPAYRSSGLSERQAADWSLYGCNWPITNGQSRTVVQRRPFLPEHFLKAFLADGPIETMEALYARFAQSIRSEATALCEEYRRWERERDSRAPGLLRVDDCFLNGPIAAARSWQLGGMPLSTVTVGFAGTATAIDCFAAVDHLLFESKRVGLDELRQALREDFAGREDLRRLCLNAPKFGADDDRADRHAGRMMSLILDELDRAAHTGQPDAVCILKSTTTDMSQKTFGAKLGATPDGRRAGQPISENTSPTPGSCRKGITAMFRSLAKLPFRRIHSGPLNVRIQPRLVKGEAGLSNLCALLRGYFKMGGMQVQLSFVSAEELREAQTHPDAHRDLMVRITGYSAVFVDMSGDAQAEIIRREEMDS